jgi:hypothetical protein
MAQRQYWGIMSTPDDDHSAEQAVASRPDTDFRSEDEGDTDVLEALFEEAAREAAERALLVQPINSIKLTQPDPYGRQQQFWEIDDPSCFGSVGVLSPCYNYGARWRGWTPSKSRRRTGFRYRRR